jgi:transcriptional regulator with XRE-family HTH domain
MTTETTGQRIKRLREQAGLGQRELADGLERCTYAYISRVEAGGRFASEKILRQIAHKLGTTAAYLEDGRQAGTCPHCLSERSR